jgi:hypothetical protein
MKICFLTSSLPFARRNGGEICSARLVSELTAAGHNVHVIGRGEVSPANCMPGVRVTSLGELPQPFAHLSVVSIVRSLTSSILLRESWTVNRMRYGIVDALRRLHTTILENDLVFIDHLQVWPWLAGSSWEGPTVLIAHNVEPAVYTALAGLHSGIERWAIRREAALLSRLDKELVCLARGIGCLTSQDAAYYNCLATGAHSRAEICVLPSFPNLDMLRRKKATATGRRIGLVGTWTWESNRAGLLWFFREVLPQIDPSVEIIVAGIGLQPSDVPTRVRALGFVNSLQEFYDSCDLIAIPTVAGSGIQEKTVEAIGHALPVVATPLAVRGLDPLPEYVKIVDDATHFALACTSWNVPAPDVCIGAAAHWSAARRSDYREALSRLLRTSRLNSGS